MQALAHGTLTAAKSTKTNL